MALDLGKRLKGKLHYRNLVFENEKNISKTLQVLKLCYHKIIFLTSIN